MSGSAASNLATRMTSKTPLRLKTAEPGAARWSQRSRPGTLGEAWQWRTVQSSQPPGEFDSHTVENGAVEISHLTESAGQHFGRQIPVRVLGKGSAASRFSVAIAPNSKARTSWDLLRTGERGFRLQRAGRQAGPGPPDNFDLCAQVRLCSLEPAMERAAFLSVRLPPETRNRVKAAAAARGQSVQELVGGLVEQFLAEQDRSHPALPAILVRLRGQEAALRQRGINGLWVFGSVARGEARPDSDIDLIAEFDQGARISLTALASLRADLADLLGTAVDLVEWGLLKPPVRAQAEREAVRVF